MKIDIIERGGFAVRQRLERILNEKLKIKHYSNTKNYKNNFSGLSDFLTEMIELNPAKINIRNKSEDDKELVHMLEKIFYDKINF